MKMIVTLKNGAQIGADVDEFSTGRSPIGGDLRSLKWTAAEKAQIVLNWVDLSEVVAVHAEFEPGEPVAEIEVPDDAGPS
jgi:hypothetical protein